MSAHWYDTNGNLVDPWTKAAMPSPSTILDILRSREYEALVARIGQEDADALMTKAAARGTRVHRACELMAKHHLDSEYLQSGAYFLDVEGALNEDEVKYTDGFLAWSVASIDHFIEVEKFVISKKYKYAGRCDLVVKLLDDSIWIIDIKTGQDNVRHGLQLKFYQQAYYEMTGIKARMGVLALDPNRACGFRNSRSPYGLKEYREPLSAIKAHLDVFKWWNKKKPAKPPTVKTDKEWTPDESIRDSRQSIPV